MEELKVSVIIPNYNHAAYLKQRLDSVINQTYKPYEIIILDDCSTDNSVEIINSYLEKNKSIKFYPNDINSGCNFIQWNKGVSLSTGNLIWIAESDDYADLQLLEKLVKSFLLNKDLVLAYCQSNTVDAKDNLTGNWKSLTDEFDVKLFGDDFVMEGKDYMDKFLIHKNTIPNASAVLFKKNIFDQVKGADLINNVSDWLVWIKILSFGKIAFIANPSNYFRRHSESIIYKAHKNKNEEFQDWYGYTMRLYLNKYLQNNRIEISKASRKVNDKYFSIDQGNFGLYQLKNKKLLVGWKLILSASFFPVFQTGFIKKAIFKK